jgi:hypothetical protein
MSERIEIVYMLGTCLVRLFRRPSVTILRGGAFGRAAAESSSITLKTKPMTLVKNTKNAKKNAANFKMGKIGARSGILTKAIRT